MSRTTPLTAAERETVILMDDESKIAKISTWQKTVMTKLDKNPAAKLVEVMKLGRQRGATYEIPARLISFRTGQRAKK